MTTIAWWGRERDPGTPAPMTHTDGAVEPQLVVADRTAVRAAVSARIPAYSPEWTNLNPNDSGVALVRLFGIELEPVLRRVDRLPESIFDVFLAAAGVRPLPPSPAETLLRFTVAPAAPDAVEIFAGMQLAAPSATGDGPAITFETTRSTTVVAATLEEIRVEESGVTNQVDVASPPPSFLPLGRRARPGRALWLGLSATGAVGRSLSLGILVATPPGSPPPATSGGILPLPIETPALLRWEVIDGGTPTPADIVLDETGGLVHSGIVELRLPARWRPGRPGVLGKGEDRRWLRLRIVHGQFERPPELRSIFINAARAVAARTIRDEVLEPVGEAGARTVMRVTQTPVLPDTLELSIEEGAVGDVFGVTADDGSTTTRWREVDDLAQWRGDDRVFELDPVSGEVTFGDGQHGARVPKGFRNVVALRYRVGGGAGGAVEADTVKTLLTSVPFVTEVTNPVPASGGTDVEPAAAVARRGPQEIRAHGRAVAVADYDLLADRAGGAVVARAHAVAGLHPAHPGRQLPGVVGVFVVPAPHAGDTGPPTPDEATLAAVARYFAREVAPAGVEVVTAAPRYHRVRVEAQLVIAADADATTVVRATATAIDEYLDPIVGGDAGRGWLFGGALRYVPLVQRVLAVPDVRAVSRLDFVVDGVRVPQCADRALSPNALVWPEVHELTAVAEAAA